MQDDSRRFYGKYRGVVTDTADPASLGRIKVTLGDFPGWKDNWCMPCVPYAGKNVGWFVIPEIDAHVWIEFEGGDPSRAIWTGCFWEAGTIPATASPSRKVWQTPTCRVVLDDLDAKAGQLEVDATIREGQTLKIRMDNDGITIESPNANVTLTANEQTLRLRPVGALAFTQGSQIHVAPGQERHLPHEAWHVVQQTSCRVAATADNRPINDDSALEREADVMARKAAEKA